MFETIKANLIEETKKDINEGKAELMAMGQNETMLRNYSTETRWNQYRDGLITEEKAREYAAKRYEKKALKVLNNKLEKLDRIASAPELQSMIITVNYSRYYSSTGTVSATVETDSNEYKEGRAGGFGYDKESSAIASALNECDSVMKVLYQYKEDRLNEGETDTDKTVSTGRNNRVIIGYGSGYSIIPYFEGGVGSECFWRIFEKLGYEVKVFNYTSKRPFYEVYKKEA